MIFFFELIARRLHTPVLSEASCQRTISQQRIIIASLRKNSPLDILNARLAIIEATIPNIKNEE